MTPADARRTFLLSLVTPQDIANAVVADPSLRDIAAEKLGVSKRTIQRMVKRHRCPCPCCLTTVHDGNVMCTFCRGHG